MKLNHALLINAMYSLLMLESVFVRNTIPVVDAALRLAIDASCEAVLQVNIFWQLLGDNFW